MSCLVLFCTGRELKAREVCSDLTALLLSLEHIEFCSKYWIKSRQSGDTYRC